MTGCLFERHITKAFLLPEAQKIANRNIPSWRPCIILQLNRPLSPTTKDPKLNSLKMQQLSYSIYNCFSLVHDSSLFVLSAVALHGGNKRLWDSCPPLARLKSPVISQQGISGQTTFVIDKNTCMKSHFHPNEMDLA